MPITIKEYYSNRLASFLNRISNREFNREGVELILNRHTKNSGETSYSITIIRSKGDISDGKIIFYPDRVITLPKPEDAKEVSEPRDAYKEIEEIYKDYRLLVDLIKKELKDVREPRCDVCPPGYHYVGTSYRENMDEIENEYYTQEYLRHGVGYQFVYRITDSNDREVKRELVYSDSNVIYTAKVY